MTPDWSEDFIVTCMEIFLNQFEFEFVMLNFILNTEGENTPPPQKNNCVKCQYFSPSLLKRMLHLL